MINLLQILFIGLKLGNVINWSWWSVMLPYEIVYGFIIFIFVLDYVMQKISPRYAMTRAVQKFERAIGHRR